MWCAFRYIVAYIIVEPYNMSMSNDEIVLTKRYRFGLQLMSVSIVQRSCTFTGEHLIG